MCLGNTNDPIAAIFLKNITLIFDLELTDDLDLSCKEKVLTQRIHM